MGAVRYVFDKLMTSISGWLTHNHSCPPFFPFVHSGLMSQILNLLAYHSYGTPFVRRLWSYLEPKVIGRKFASDGRDGANNLLLRYHSALHLLFSVYR